MREAANAASQGRLARAVKAGTGWMLPMRDSLVVVLTPRFVLTLARPGRRVAAKSRLRIWPLIQRGRMGLKDRYHINDPTWTKLKRVLQIVLVGMPFLSAVIAFVTWPIITTLSWAPAIAISCLLFCATVVVFHRLLMVRSKYTILLMACGLSLYELYFVTLSSACVYRFFGMHGILAQNLLLLATGSFLCRHYYHYWDGVWESHKRYNETVALDLENGRYDFLNNFNMDTDKLNKGHKRGLSRAALRDVALTIAPIGVGISLLFAKGRGYAAPIAIMWVLSIPFILGFLKMVVGVFYGFRKLSYYEKKCGKPIINGLLD
jgi:hypothetical protein